MNLRPSDKHVIRALLERPMTMGQLVAALLGVVSDRAIRDVRSRLLGGLLKASTKGRDAVLSVVPEALPEDFRKFPEVSGTGGVRGGPNPSVGSFVSSEESTTKQTNQPASGDPGSLPEVASGIPELLPERRALLLAQTAHEEARADYWRARAEQVRSGIVHRGIKPENVPAPPVSFTERAKDLPLNSSAYVKDVQPMPQTGSLGESIDRLRVLLRRNRERSEQEAEACLAQALKFSEEQVRRSVASVELREARGKTHDDPGAYAMKLIRSAETFEQGALGDWREIDKRIDEARKSPKRINGKLVQDPKDSPDYVDPEKLAKAKAKAADIERRIMEAVHGEGARK